MEELKEERRDAYCRPISPEANFNWMPPLSVVVDRPDEDGCSEDETFITDGRTTRPPQIITCECATHTDEEKLRTTSECATQTTEEETTKNECATQTAEVEEASHTVPAVSPTPSLVDAAPPPPYTGGKFLYERDGICSSRSAARYEKPAGDNIAVPEPKWTEHAIARGPPGCD